VKRWTGPTQVEIARETPENMPRLTFAIQRQAAAIATLSPAQFKRAFPEFCFLSKNRARYWPRRLAIAKVITVAAIHIDHGRQFMQYPIATATGGLAEEAGLKPCRAWRAVDDLRIAGWFRSAKQRKIEKPAAGAGGRRFIALAVRRHVEPLMYRRLEVNLEADHERKRYEKNRDDGQALDRAAAAARVASEERRLAKLKSAPAAPPLAPDPVADARAVGAIEQLRARLEAEPPAPTSTGPPPDE
jgi:hypothetical protein